jgi:hypothetical protein
MFRKFEGSIGTISNGLTTLASCTILWRSLGTNAFVTPFLLYQTKVGIAWKETMLLTRNHCSICSNNPNVTIKRKRNTIIPFLFCPAELTLHTISHFVFVIPMFKHLEKTWCYFIISPSGYSFIPHTHVRLLCITYTDGKVEAGQLTAIKYLC